MHICKNPQSIENTGFLLFTITAKWLFCLITLADYAIIGAVDCINMQLTDCGVLRRCMGNYAARRCVRADVKWRIPKRRPIPNANGRGAAEKRERHRPGA